jgi:uncharacterized membrane protein YobD (UPF0266 family)
MFCEREEMMANMNTTIEFNGLESGKFEKDTDATYFNQMIAEGGALVIALSISFCLFWSVILLILPLLHGGFVDGSIIYPLLILCLQVYCGRTLARISMGVSMILLGFYIEFISLSNIVSKSPPFAFFSRIFGIFWAIGAVILLFSPSVSKFMVTQKEIYPRISIVNDTNTFLSRIPRVVGGVSRFLDQ